MTDYEIDAIYQGNDEFDLNIRWDDLNAISLSMTEKQLRKIRSEIECILTELMEEKQ